MICCVAGGCLGRRAADPTATQPVTAVDPAQAEPEYWLNQPPTVEVVADDFDRLWSTCERVAQEHMMPVDYRDYRRGMLKTEAVISKQWFELWRKDVGTWRDVAEASLGTVRRTIYFQFARNPDGSYVVWPRVLVERRSYAEPEDQSGVQAGPARWYALGRDTVLESRLAGAIRRKLGG